VPNSLHANYVQLFVSSYLSFRRTHPNRPSLSSSHCDAFLSNYHRFVSQRKCELENLFRRSDLRLQPFEDPLRGHLLMSFILSTEREENYSAVLEWLIRRLPADEVLQVFGLDECGTDQSQPWEITREYQVSHLGQIGRLDLLLRRNGKCRVVVEVKTKPYAEEDLQKHELYCAAIREAPDMRESEKVFLAQRHEDMDLGGFCFRSWRQICLGLRRSSRSVISVLPYGEAALYLALLGAIEQNLLDLNPNRGSNAPALFSYLQEHLQEGVGYAD
jgi:hypothetical protein